jgi:hypothetical protein
VAGVVPPTVRVLMLNVAAVAPDGTVTLAATVSGSVADSSTSAPLVGAAAVSVAVPVTLPPPITVDALSEMDPSAAAAATVGTGDGAGVGAVGDAAPHAAARRAPVRTKMRNEDRRELTIIWSCLGIDARGTKRRMQNASIDHTTLLNRGVPVCSILTTLRDSFAGLIARGGSELDYPFHDWTAVVTRCGRICYQRRKINLNQVFAGQKVGVKQTAEHIWLVSFMEYDLGYFDDETCRLEPIEDPFAPRLSPMSPE